MDSSAFSGNNGYSGIRVTKFATISLLVILVLAAWKVVDLGIMFGYFISRHWK